MPAISKKVAAKSTFVMMASQRLRCNFGRPFHQQRHLQRLVEHEAFVEPAVVAEEEPLVRCVHDECVLREVAFVEVVQSLPTLSSMDWMHCR